MRLLNYPGDLQNILLASVQGGITINARLGEPYGTIEGTNFVYTDGQKTVNSTTTVGSRSVNTSFLQPQKYWVVSNQTGKVV